MSEYTLQTLRLNQIFEDKDAAIAFLNGFKYHKKAQPIALRYYNNFGNGDQTISSLLAVGDREGNGTECGEDYYTIINTTNDISWNEIVL
ncbi:MAG: hypothetical protein IIZ78_03410 [Clostridiales bacterium]|nr:hypothetical protein [Clostridiales bacterium]